MIRIALLLLGTVALTTGCVPRDDPAAGAQSARVTEAKLHAEAKQAVRVPQSAPTHATESLPPAPVIEQTLRDDPDPERRREAVYALADADPASSAAVIGEALYDSDARVREAAIEAMTGIDDGTSVDWLSLGLGDPEPRVRRAAVEALGQVGGETARFLLEQALGDADPGVREAARQMLEEPAFADEGVS
jgi:hypothetical protein